MTFGNDHAQPDPADDPNAQAAAPDGELQYDSNDPDVIEWNKARAAVKAEETAEGAEGQTTGAEAGQPQTAQQSQQDRQPPQGQQQQPQPQVEQIMVPKARLDEVLQRERQAAEQAAYWRGIAEARAQGQQAPATAQTQPQPQLTPEQQIAQIRKDIDELAAKFDNGEITMADFKRQERDLQDREFGIRNQMLLSQIRPQAQTPAQSDELYLETLTAQLEARHPWTQVFEKVGTDADWDYLKHLAIDNLTGRGIDPRAGNVGKFELRKEMARLADELGPALVGPRAQKAGIAIPNGPSHQQQPRQLSQEALARQAKLQQAQGAPPDLAAMHGNRGDDLAAPSEARIEQMSEAELDALPETTRRRLLGITA